MQNDLAFKLIKKELVNTMPYLNASKEVFKVLDHIISTHAVSRLTFEPAVFEDAWLVGIYYFTEFNNCHAEYIFLLLNEEKRICAIKHSEDERCPSFLTDMASALHSKKEPITH